jgi:hypothetical protein
LHRYPRSPNPPPSSSSSDEADSGRVIGLEDFVKDPAEEERALAEALAQMTEEVAMQQTAEKANRCAALCAVEAFQAREAACAHRMAEAARIQAREALEQRLAAAAHALLPLSPILGRRYCRRLAPMSSPEAEFCTV